MTATRRGDFPAVSVIVDAMNRAPSVYRVDRLDLSFAPKPWAFAIERRA